MITTIGYLQLFEEPFVMTGGGPLDQAAFTASLFVYQQGFRFFNLRGYASAAAYTLVHPHRRPRDRAVPRPEGEEMTAIRIPAVSARARRRASREVRGRAPWWLFVLLGLGLILDHRAVPVDAARLDQAAGRLPAHDAQAWLPETVDAG